MTGSEDVFINGSAQLALHAKPLSQLIGAVLGALLGWVLVVDPVKEATVSDPKVLGPGGWRTARKEHVCWHCKEPILKGERHYEYVGATPAWQSGDRYHTPCAFEAIPARDDPAWLPPWATRGASTEGEPDGTD